MVNRKVHALKDEAVRVPTEEAETAHGRIGRGLKQALAFAQGDTAGAAVHVVAVPDRQEDRPPSERED